MTYKDQTFCGDWCDNITCFRNYQHIVDAKKPDGFLAVNTWMPIAFFMVPPINCTERIPKDANP